MHDINQSNNRSRKFPIFAALPMIALIFALVLGGCGKSGSEGASSRADSAANGRVPSQNAQEASHSNEQEIVIKHDYGESTIPANPKRIVSIGMEDMLLSLDVPLVQAFSTDGYYLDAQIKEKGIPINSSFDINLEAIAAVDPDLIVMNTYMTDQSGYEQLSKIAPTIAFVRDNWQSAIVDIGRALGKEGQADALLQTYEDKLKQARETIVQAVGKDKTVAFIRPSTKEVELDFPEYAWTYILYNELGLKPDPAVLEFQKNNKEDTWGGTMLSLEKLPELTADYLFMDYGASMANEAEFQQDVAKASGVEQLKVWKVIPAVAKGQAYKVSARHWALNGPIADEMKIDDIVNILAANQ